MKKLIIWTLAIFLIGGFISLKIAKAQVEPLKIHYDNELKELRQQQEIYEQNIQKLKDRLDPTKLNQEEVDLLSKLIYVEARGESFEGMVAVGAVVLNRKQSGRFPNSVQEVIYSPGQFTKVGSRTNEQCTRAAQKALLGIDPTDGAVYFHNPRISRDKWIGTRQAVKTIGNHEFML